MELVNKNIIFIDSFGDREIFEISYRLSSPHPRFCSFRKFDLYFYRKKSLKMAEQEPVPIDNEEPEETPGYKAPEQKSLNDIKNLDADDESLVKYKEALLAGVDPNAGKFIYFF